MCRDGLVIPTDEGAECAVIGTVIGSGRAIIAVAGIVAPGDFWWPLHSRLFAAAPALRYLRREEHRVHAFAEAAQTEERDVRELMTWAPVIFDSSPWARRVARTARLRRIMLIADDLRRAVGEATPDERVDALLSELAVERPAPCTRP